MPQCLPALHTEALQYMACRFFISHLLHLSLSFQILLLEASQFVHFLSGAREKVA